MNINRECNYDRNIYNSEDAGNASQENFLSQDPDSLYFSVFSIFDENAPTSSTPLQSSNSNLRRVSKAYNLNRMADYNPQDEARKQDICIENSDPKATEKEGNDAKYFIEKNTFSRVDVSKLFPGIDFKK